MFGRVEDTGPADSGGDSNATSASMVTSVPIMLFFIVRIFLKGKKRWPLFLLSIFLAYTLNGIVLINSRGSFLGLMAGFAYLFLVAFFDRHVTLKQRFQMLFLTVLGIASFLYLADDAFWERMDTIFEEKDEEGGGGGRKAYWQAAVEIAKDHPFGVGGWGFQYLSSQYVPAEFMMGRVGKAVHSLYFQCIAERGFIGFAFFMMLILSSFRFSRKTKKFALQQGDRDGYYLGVCLESSFFGFLVAAAFINRLNAEILYWMPLWIGIYGNVYMLKRKKNVGSSSGEGFDSVV
jgi:O-antigen ligase